MLFVHLKIEKSSEFPEDAQSLATTLYWELEKEIGNVIVEYAESLT